MTKAGSKEQVLRPEGIQKLLEGRVDDLSEDERALLLALISVQAERGEDLDEGERAAVDRLKAQLEGYDVDELTQAVKHMVTAKSQKDQDLDWPDLKERLHGRQRSE